MERLVTTVMEKLVARLPGSLPGRRVRITSVALLACVTVPCVVSVSGRAQPRTEMQRLVQVENDRVSVWRSVIPPGAESTLHRHGRNRIVIGIVGGDLKTVTAAGQATVTRYETGKAYWQDPMPSGQTHKDVNDSSSTIELMVVELKQ